MARRGVGAVVGNGVGFPIAGFRFVIVVTFMAARAMSRFFRVSGVVFRIGGDFFGIVAVTTGALAMAVAVFTVSVAISISISVSVAIVMSA